MQNSVINTSFWCSFSSDSLLFQVKISRNWKFSRMWGVPWKVNCGCVQKQLLLTHLCLPGAFLCDFFFYSWLMQYFKISNSQEIFGTGWCFWTLTVGRLISQLTRAAPHNIIYIKQGLISIRALLWISGWLVYICSEPGRTPGSHSHKWVVKSRFCCFQHWLVLPGLLQGTQALPGKTTSHLHFSWYFIPGAFSILKSALRSFTASIFPASVSVLQHHSLVLCLVTSWQVFLWEILMLWIFEELEEVSFWIDTCSEYFIWQA